VPRSTDTEIRGLLGCFLFSDGDVFKPIGVLSGGERNRYALARMLMVPSNLILLDEPTNHLDLRAKDVLLSALLAFSGTAVFVSHDRHFIDRLATRVFEIGDGTVRVYSGNYEDYLWQKERGSTSLSRAPAGAAPPNGRELRPEAAAKGVPRLNPLKIQQMKRRVAELEQQSEVLEREIGLLEAQLAGSFHDHRESKRLVKEIGGRKERLDTLLAEWEQVGAALET
jgi:ATP-binding cassette subfamily F protein 3